MCAVTLYIKSTKGKGRGVYCNHPILKDEIIEQCPLLVIPASDHKFGINKVGRLFFLL